MISDDYFQWTRFSGLYLVSSRIWIATTPIPPNCPTRDRSWPNSLFAPITQWPDLRPLWETVDVKEINLQLTTAKRGYEGQPRADLIAAALEQGFNADDAVARNIRLVGRPR